MSNALGGRQGTSYLGTNAASPPNWTFHTDSPTIYNSQNFSLGDMWLNTTLQDAFVLTSLAFNPVSNVREAVWFQFANGPQTGTINQLIAADGTIANPLNGQITFPNAVITANTNPVSNILTSVQPNNSSDFLVNLTPQISLRNNVNGVDSITLEQISVSGGAWNSTIKFLRADGTIAVPTAVSNDFGLGSIRWFGYTGSGYTSAPSACIKALVKGVVVDNIDPTLREVPTCIAFAVSKTMITAPFNLASLDIKLQIDPDGQVYVKNGTYPVSATYANAALHVDSPTLLSGGAGSCIKTTQHAGAQFSLLSVQDSNDVQGVIYCTDKSNAANDVIPNNILWQIYNRGQLNGAQTTGTSFRSIVENITGVAPLATINAGFDWWTTVNGVFLPKLKLTSAGMLNFFIQGIGIGIKTGTNPKLGTATLTGGAVTIANTSINSNATYISKIFLQRTNINASGAIGNLCVTAIVNATSFTVTSISDAAGPVGLDNSSFSYFIVEELQ
ncbi:hypothetical protein UFOVP1478_38 [uncultured Caudovirales phage]|uniref:K1 capsule-specific polysaccharide lyase C-terminal domain-containing protein n=1 Tax=uncultured Caudovirales phage TaxID=2100421 RepID=A0A6J5QVI7_9CAUD|nr:hypothetical protein UFOVP1112_31 [uncultured Caudovirales phage]CAB4203780.1 hypothetical protein UFOVP1385_4 [uncultured Caudovirales phage]CAB4215573.1 hypothetical protein UFOVP1478_38 [uncultured Caudovirales phage]